MKKRILAALLATTVMTGLMAGCTSDSGSGDTTTPAATNAGETTAAGGGEVQDVTLKVWTPENQHTNGTIESMGEAFQELHPEYNIEFVYEVVGEDVINAEILKDVGAAADVFFFVGDGAMELADAGAIARLGGSTLEMIESSIEQTVINTVTDPEDGAVYGIPFTHNTYYMYYDKTLMTEEDVKSLETIINKETPENVINFQFDSAGGWKGGAYYYGAGNQVFGASGSDYAAGCDWNNETGLAVTNYLIDLRNNPKVAFDSGINVSEKITNHELGVWFDGSWNHQMYLDILGDDLGLGVIPTFNVNGTDTQLKAFYGSKAIGVNAQSKNLPVAIEFAAFIGNEENQLKRYVESGQIPANINAAQDAAVQADPVAAAIVGMVEKAIVVQPANSNFSAKYWSNATSLFTEITSGELTKDNAQEKLDTFVANFIVE